MDSLILNQSLEIYGQSLVAICRLPARTSEALNLLKKGWSSVVVLDQNDQPQGLFSARCLLNWQAESEQCTFVAPAIALEDIDLEPLPTISISMTVADFLQRISQYRHSAEIWALVSGDGKFAGILEVSSLLRLLVKTEESEKTSVISLLLPLIYQIPLPVMVSDHDGTIVGMNSAWRNSLYEISPRSGVQRLEGGRDVALDLASMEDSPQILQANLPETHEFCTTDGASFTWQVVNVALQGSLQGLEMAIAYDITAQKNLAQELSGLSRLKDEFLTCINHELKTPLTSVIGIASLLSNNTFGELNERQSRYVKMIHQSGRQLVSIIDNMFDLAKAEAGQLELYSETISVKDVCLKSIQQVRKLVQQDSAISRNYNFEEGWELDINLDIDPTIQTISADEARLQQMLVNLLSNAFKFSVLPSGLVGDLPHNAPQIGITVRWWEGWLAITVWDQGIGIPEDKQSLVFQKFQQMENVLTRRFEGTGSSLLLTRHLARLHGGDITFVSQVDVGSQFTILLPPEPVNTDTQTSRIDGARTRLVLIVETSSEEVEVLRKTLADLDYQVVIARSGTEALEKARRLQPCLILLSPNLPMLSGWDVLALLKGDPVTQHIRMVMMKRADEPRISTHQADGILLKPIKAAELNVFLPHYANIPKSLKFVYLNQNLDDTIIHLLQDLGHCLLEADDLTQCDVLSKIWQPDLFLLDGDNHFLLKHLETISHLEVLANLPILIITRSSVAEIDWLKKKFPSLSLHDCIGLQLEHLDSNRAEILLALHQSITNAVSYVTTHILTNTLNN
ncbi:ATP-binding protein [Pseudanabaena sp. ABRG5-3]|uniref:ATP-binding protein n=1 Tax=Pseudanabaena sp. ABRG5-3 TaxID=685565 RepID=UPI000DC70F5A|nr:ATP-binding protein [Pseudanabaena sp. ABRG5-3]BBC26569.1 histidine kinase [Pseudanabaena sp. ABRG5-3]